MARARSPSRPSMRAPGAAGVCSGRARPDRGMAPVAVWAVRLVPAAREIADVVTSLLPWASVGGATAVPAASIVTGGADAATPRGIPCRGGRGSERGGAPAGQGHDVRAWHRAGRRLPVVDARTRARARSRRARPQHHGRTRGDRGPGEPGGGRRPRGPAAREPLDDPTARPRRGRRRAARRSEGRDHRIRRSAEPPRLAA